MSVTDPITGVTRPMTADELEERRRDRGRRVAYAGLFVVGAGLLAVGFWIGGTL